MADGRVLEHDRPRALLSRQGSSFRAMVDSIGTGAVARFADMAERGEREASARGRRS